MYQVTIKGRNLAELKQAVSDINQELHAGSKVVTGMVKDLEEKPLSKNEEKIKQVAQLADEVLDSPVAAPVETVEEEVHTTGELDSEGVMWDSRIHAKTMTKTQKGVWKLKRGIDKDLVAKILADQFANKPVTPVAEVAPAVTPVAEVAPVIPSMNLNTSGGHTVETFSANLPMVLAGLINDPNVPVNQEYIQSLKQHFEVAEIWQLSNEQKAELFNFFVQNGIIQAVG